MGVNHHFSLPGWPSTSGWPKILIDGDAANLPPVPPQHFIDVRDCARIHVAALVSPTAESERFWGFAEPYNYNQILAIFRKLWPQRKFIDDLPDMGRDLMTAPRESAEELLKVFGQDGWTSLQNSLRDAFDPLVTSEL
jgi:nucleoside-diphosphate-sugar epimerase